VLKFHSSASQCRGARSSYEAIGSNSGVASLEVLESGEVMEMVSESGEVMEMMKEDEGELEETEEEEAIIRGSKVC
jgi:hypothetical protein